MLSNEMYMYYIGYIIYFNIFIKYFIYIIILNHIRYNSIINILTIIIIYNK